jgi:hypothetical protein
MKTRIVSLFMLLSVTNLAYSQELNFCKTDVSSKSCQSYIAGLVDSALLYAPQGSTGTLAVDDFEERALKFRAGNRYKKAHSAHCSHSADEALDIAAALEEQLMLNTITNLEELKLFLDTVLKCDAS